MYPLRLIIPFVLLVIIPSNPVHGGYVEYQGRCVNDKNITEYDYDNDYEEYSTDCIKGDAANQYCKGKQDCLDWCALRVDDDGNNLTWPSYTACELNNGSNIYCHIYGEATIIGGDGDPEIWCWAYDGYECGFGGCYWSGYQEGVDWGYYSQTYGDCDECKKNCTNDLNCGGLECGLNYCIWWKVGKCATDEERTSSGYSCFKPVEETIPPPPECGSLSWHYPESPANGWLGAGSCNGTMQSPIDLNGALEATVHAPIEYRNYFVSPNNNNRFYSGILQNNGHSIVWHLHSTETNRLAFCWKHGKCPSIRNGPFAGVKHTHAYYLLQLHFHWGDNGNHWNKGSEHTVDGMQYPLEMHMVHIEDRYIDSEGTYDWDGALADPSGLAVLAVFFNVDPKKPQNMQPLEVIDETLEDMANVPKERRKRGADADEEAQMEEMARFHEAFEQLTAHRVKRQILHHTEVKLRLNPGAFIRKATNRGYHANEYSTYWTYHGSLTTPCCNEVVTWVVFDRVLHITQVQVNAFVHKFPNNFRTPNNLGSHNSMDRVDTRCGREIRLIHDQVEHHMGGFWG